MKNQVLLVAALFTLLLSLSFCNSKNNNSDYIAIKEDSIQIPQNHNGIQPVILVKKSSGDTSVPLHISELIISIKVVGNIATTTMEMNFYNDLNRLLEGQLYFPLAQGQRITHFAMDVEGKLRDAVIVEKAVGRQAFESTVRKNIDPGLLEWTKGNSFKARIYPIPAKGNKRIIISYIEELKSSKQSSLYILPLSFKNKIDRFKLDVEVVQQPIKPHLQYNEMDGIEFKEWHESYISNVEKINYLANKQLAFILPKSETLKTVVVEPISVKSDSSFFYINLNPQQYSKIKKLPENICLLWDVSSSAAKKNVQLELNILDIYFKKISNLDVELVTFSNKIHSNKVYQITNGNWSDLRKDIELLQYDGGTQLGNLDLNKYTCDEFILSSDGISNFGKEGIQISDKPIITMSSIPVSEYSYLMLLSAQTNGAFINLNNTTAKQAVDKLTNDEFKFISAEYNTNEIEEVYPSIPTSFSNSFSIVGVLKVPTSEITLNFGIGNHIIYSEKYHIKRRNTQTEINILPSIWANKKIAELDVNYVRNKGEITDLGKKFGIITRNTSLIVLDRLEDYVEHRIVPPIEMQKAYFEQINKIVDLTKKQEKQHLEKVITAFDERYKWWKANHKKKMRIPIVTDSLRHEEHSANGIDVRRHDVVVEAVADDVNIEMDGEEVASFDSEEVPVIANNNGIIRHLPPAINRRDQIERKPKAKSSIEIHKWDPKATYLKGIKAVAKDSAYYYYMSIKHDYEKSPALYLDVSDYLAEIGQNEKALRVLSNIAEMELENPQLLRVLGHRLQQLGYYDLSILVFKEVLNLREEEPQSYRDLANSYASNGDYQKAIDYLNKVIMHSWDTRFPNIEVIAAVELNAIISKSDSTLNTSEVDAHFLKAMPVDIRVVIDWDTDDCDMDLWVTDPQGEKCMYNHNRTRIGGYLTNDFTQGYGPEVFFIRKAVKGNYKVQVNYYGSSQQQLAGPTTVMAKLYTNYGTKYQELEEITIRLSATKEVIDIGKLHFGD